MSFGIVLRVEEQVAQALRTHMQALFRACGGVDLVALKIPAHLTLALGEEPVPAGLEAALAPAFEGAGTLPLTFSSTGVFGGDGGVVFLGPAVTPALLALHARAHAAFARAGAVSLPYYRPEAWVPHLTVGHGVEAQRLGSAVQRSRDLLPMTTRATRVELVRSDLEVRPGFDVLTSLRL
jgi:2'-5' RNA ligase